mgnify:CR=1 FL=1
MNSELKETDAAKARLAHDNIERTEYANQAQAQRSEAVNALEKLGEVRVLMNRLMGPTGSLTQGERAKFLPTNTDEP